MTVSVVFAMVLLALPGGVSSAGPAGAGSQARLAGGIAQTSFPDLWGYGVGRKPHEATYSPGSHSSGDDMGTPVTIVHDAVGIYGVQFPDDFPQAPNLGMVLVTAISTTGGFCTVYDLGQQASLEQILVKCFNRTGQLTDTKFSASYLDDQALAGHVGYLLAGQPSTTDYTPDMSYQFNSTGGTNTVHRVGVGLYDVRLPGLATSKGHAQVTATESGLCRVRTWGPDGSDEVLRVVCHDEAGNPSDATYELLFTRKQGLMAHGASGQSYLMADQPKAASYTPAAAFRWSSNGHAPHITRSGTGRFTVTLSGFAAGGAAQITPYGRGGSRCALTSIAKTGPVAKIGVLCTRPDGRPVDTKFGVAFEVSEER